MERQSIYERVMLRDEAEKRDEEVTLEDVTHEGETVAERGRKETRSVKTRKGMLLISFTGGFILAAVATVVLARPDVISLKRGSPGQDGTAKELVTANDLFADLTAADSATATGALAKPADSAPIEVAQADSGTTTSDKDTAAAVGVPSGQQRTVFNEHVDKAGVTACKDVFPTLGFAAAAGSTFNATTSWSDRDPNEHSISSIIGMSFNSDQLKGSGASFVFSAPTPTKGGCEGTFVRIVPVAQDCGEFASSLPKGSKAGISLQGIPVITLPSGLQTLLVPTIGKGCVVVTTSRAATPINQ
ncbi:MAG: hypothetical protein KGI75_08875 [Rhizobiaceae bacterium]|nr:hypothetical protein [Rhizobiaceae bacterium]